MWLSGMSGYDAGGVASQLGTIKSPTCNCAQLQVGTHPDMTLDVARRKTTNNILFVLLFED